MQYHDKPHVPFACSSTSKKSDMDVNPLKRARDSILGSNSWQNQTCQVCLGEGAVARSASILFTNKNRNTLMVKGNVTGCNHSPIILLRRSEEDI